MAILRSSSRGFTLIECVLALGLFCLLAMLLSKALALFLQQWSLHERSWQQVRQGVHIAASLDGWFRTAQDGCSPVCGCEVRNESVDESGGDMFRIATCDGNDPVWARLFVAPYHGVGGDDLGLYTKLGDHPRQLLVKHVSKFQVLACSSQEKVWHDIVDFEGAQHCQGVLVQVVSGENQTWRQVLL